MPWPSSGWWCLISHLRGVYDRTMCHGAWQVQWGGQKLVPTLDAVFDGLTDFVAKHMRVDTLLRLLV